MKKKIADIVVPLDDDLRQAVYRAYKGLCQYCAHPEPLPPLGFQVDHIIPQNKSIAEVRSSLEKVGLPLDLVHNFCESLLPKEIGSLGNITLACPKHNWNKLDKVPPPLAMYILFQKAQENSLLILKELQNPGFSPSVNRDRHVDREVLPSPPPA